MSDLGSEGLPLRVAVVGSGPSGFYAADALLKSSPSIQVDMYERLPAPFGLVRYGVAPDHQKIKNVIRAYTRTAEHPNFSYIGNVTIGEDITVDELRAHYDAVVLAIGAETDRRLGIPGEDLPGSRTATEFVAWYNGHPDYRHLDFDLKYEIVPVIGQGNVAIDVTRVLGKTVDELAATDIAAHALEALAESQVKEVHMIGRRGPAQVAFTEQEILELGALSDCDIEVSPKDLELNAASEAELQMPQNATKAKNYKILCEYAARTHDGKNRRIRIDFFRSPIELLGDGRLEEVVFERNALSGDAGTQRARGTGETEVMACHEIFRSVGYRGVALDDLPFDERWGTIPHQDGRVVDEGGDVVERMYVVGWIKRGPSGLIGTNRADSVATVQSLLQDAATFTPCASRDTESLLALAAERGVRTVSFEDWKKIDSAEVERGAAAGKPREKFATVEEMLAVLGE